MRITYTKSEKTSRKILKLIERNQLMYMYGGMSKLIESGKTPNIMTLAWIDKKLIGWCVIEESLIMWGCNIGCYVHPNYRKLRIGSKLVQHALRNYSIDTKDIIYEKSKYQFYGSCLPGINQIS